MVAALAALRWPLLVACLFERPQQPEGPLQHADGFHDSGLAHGAGVKVRRHLSLHWLDVKVRWRTNVHRLTVKASLVRHGRIIWARTRSLTNLTGSPGSTTFTWQRPRRIKQALRSR
jgi:hypothetical protein